MGRFDARCRQLVYRDLPDEEAAALIKELELSIRPLLSVSSDLHAKRISRSSDLSQHKLLGRFEKWCRGHPGDKFAMYQHPAVYQDIGAKAATPVQHQEDHSFAS